MITALTIIPGGLGRSNLGGNITFRKANAHRKRQVTRGTNKQQTQHHPLTLVRTRTKLWRSPHTLENDQGRYAIKNKILHLDIATLAKHRHPAPDRIFRAKWCVLLHPLKKLPQNADSSTNTNLTSYVGAQFHHACPKVLLCNWDVISNGGT
jgi:hypothetical protein